MFFPLPHCQQLIKPTFTNPFLTFFSCILSLPCHPWVHTTDRKPTFYQAERASGRGPAEPKAVALAMAMAKQGLRMGCSFLTEPSECSKRLLSLSSLFLPSILSFKERVNMSDPVRGTENCTLAVTSCFFYFFNVKWPASVSGLA